MSVCFFAVYSSNRGIACKTTKVYITGVLHQNSMLGANAPLSLMPVLHRVIRGIQRRQGNTLTRKKRKPITTTHLRKISKFLLLSGHPPHDKYMLLASCLTAFFGLKGFRVYLPYPQFLRPKHSPAKIRPALQHRVFYHVITN
uniref:Uncharacterized protein n=1 Tax=Clytia hemisphaerica TaxID=252671 RepID=A0A7M5X2K8_9CNID